MENKDSNSPSHSCNYRIIKKYKTWLYIYGEREREREYGRHGGGLLMQYWMPGSCSFTGCGWTSSGFLLLLLPPPPPVLFPPPPLPVLPALLPPPPLPVLPALLPPHWAMSFWETVTKEGRSSKEKKVYYRRRAKSLNKWLVFLKKIRPLYVFISRYHYKRLNQFNNYQKEW